MTKFRSLFTIESPAGAVIRSRASLYLCGFAPDDRTVRVANLTWYVDNVAMGSGESISLAGLTPGTRTIRLSAKDYLGRTASALVKVNVSPE